MLPEWLHNLLQNPGILLVGFGLLFAVLATFNGLHGASPATGLMGLASVNCIWWGSYTHELKQKVGFNPGPAVYSPVSTGSERMLIIAAVCLVLMLGVTVEMRVKCKRSFQTAFLASAVMCSGACLAYQYMLWHPRDNHMPFLISVLEVAAAVVLVLGLAVAQYLLFAAVCQARVHADHWARTASSLRSELDQVQQPQRVTTEVVTMGSTRA